MSTTFIQFIAGLDKVGKKAVRIAIVIILLWIGALKFFTYEADGIVPFVANSPLMSFFYRHSGDYKHHINKEGELDVANHQWQMENNTYGFATGLGIFLIALAILVGLHSVAPLLSMIGSGFVVLLTFGTLSFLVTTPECWIPHLNGDVWGFPFLSGRGRLVAKDLAILGGAVVTMSESAAFYLRRRVGNKNNS
jgi:reactive chlorine resistance protein C